MSMDDPYRLARIRQLREAENTLRHLGKLWPLVARLIGWWRRHVLLDSAKG